MFGRGRLCSIEHINSLLNHSLLADIATSPEDNADHDGRYIPYSSLADSTYTLDTASITLAAGDLRAETLTADVDIFAGGDITALAGEVRAEQITSDDDLTMSGHSFILGDGTANDIVMTFLGNEGTDHITYDQSAREFEIDCDLTVEGDFAAGVTTILSDAGSQLTIAYDVDNKVVFDVGGGGIVTVSEAIAFNFGDVPLAANVAGFGSLVADTLTVNTNTLVVNATGYEDMVGIGTATPTVELDVVGSGLFSTDLTVAGDIYVATSVRHYEDVGDNTHITFVEDGIYQTAGGVAISLALEAGQDAFIVSPNQNDVDFIARSATAAELFKVDAGTDTVSVTGTTKLGDGGTTNFSEFEADGTYKMNGVATVWDDIVLPLDSARVPAANAPDWESFVGNLKKFAYKVGDFQEFTAELLHGYKEGSAFTFHIHGALNATTAQEEKVQFEIEYSVADKNTTTGIGDVFPDGSGSLLTHELVVPNATPDLTNIFITIGVDSAATFAIGATIVGRIRRIAKSAGGVELTGNIFVTQVGIHYEQDTVGSRTELTK